LTSDLRPLRLGEEKKKEEDRKKPQGKNIMVCPIHRATIMNQTSYLKTLS